MLHSSFTTSTVFWFVVVVVALTTTITTTNAEFITTINTRALRSLIQDVRNQVLPNFINLINDIALTDTLTVTAQVGSLLDTGVKATVGLSNFQINNNTLNDPILTTSNNNNNDIARLTFTTRNIDLQTKVTSNIALSLGLGGSGIQCQPSLRVFVQLPQLSFNVDLVRNTRAGSSGKSFDANMNTLVIDPTELFITVVDDTSGLCDNILQPITNVINQITTTLRQRITNTFQSTISNYINNFVFDSIPVAYDVPISMGSGTLQIGLGIQTLQSTNNGILSVFGTSFTSTITEIEWRDQYYYNRALVDTTTTSDIIDTASALLNNNDKLIQLQLSYPPINNFIAAIWYQIWSTFATNSDVLNNMEDFCTIPNNNDNTTTEQPPQQQGPILDPCPFPPIRLPPFSIFDNILLRTFFFGNTNFQYQTVITPPIMEILNDNVESLSDIVLQGRVPSKVVLRGTPTATSGILQLLFGNNRQSDDDDDDNNNNSERTIAALDVDIVIDMKLPFYNRDTGIIEWDDNGFNIRIENAISVTRFPRFGNAFTNLATKFINQFITTRFVTPINNGIRFGLQQIPIKIPTFENLPLRNAFIDFTFPNFEMNFNNAMTMSSDLNIDITYPSDSSASSSLIMSSNDVTDESDTITESIIALTEDVFTNESSDEDITLIVYTTATDTDTITSRVSQNNNDGTYIVENYINGEWVTTVPK